MTYKTLGILISNNAALVWSTNASESNIGKILRAQNETLRIVAGSHRMSSIDDLHNETEMIQVEDQLNLPSVQYLVHCLDTENVCHHITMMDHPLREMKEILSPDIVTPCYRCWQSPRKTHSRQFTPHLSIHQ